MIDHPDAAQVLPRVECRRGIEHRCDGVHLLVERSRSSQVVEILHIERTAKRAPLDVGTFLLGELGIVCPPRDESPFRFRVVSVATGQQEFAPHLAEGELRLEVNEAFTDLRSAEQFVHQAVPRRACATIIVLKAHHDDCCLSGIGPERVAQQEQGILEARVRCQDTVMNDEVIAIVSGAYCRPQVKGTDARCPLLSQGKVLRLAEHIAKVAPRKAVARACIMGTRDGQLHEVGIVADTPHPVVAWVVDILCLHAHLRCNGNGQEKSQEKSLHRLT